jgi:hypothetical protein
VRAPPAMWKPPVNFLTLHCTWDQSAQGSFLQGCLWTHLTLSLRYMDSPPRNSQPRHHLSLRKPQSRGCLLLWRQRLHGIGTKYVRWQTEPPSFYVWSEFSQAHYRLSIDVNTLKTYQQVYIYLIPILANLGFINIIVVVVRLYWFEKRLRSVGKAALVRWLVKQVGVD